MVVVISIVVITDEDHVPVVEGHVPVLAKSSSTWSC